PGERLVHPPSRFGEPAASGPLWALGRRPIRRVARDQNTVVARQRYFVELGRGGPDPALARRRATERLEFQAEVQHLALLVDGALDRAHDDRLEAGETGERSADRR